MQISAEKEKEYVKAKGSFCPFCGTKEIDADSPEMGDDDISVFVTCENGHSWTDIFVLSGILEALSETE